jgi:uncharacterized membrane protein
VLLLKKQEHDYLIARIGLQGTLWGAWGCLIVIVLIVISPAFTTRNILEGWQIVAMTGIMVSAIVFYGTFIFKRALTGTATIGGMVISLETQQMILDQMKKTPAAGARAPRKIETGSERN